MGCFGGKLSETFEVAHANLDETLISTETLFL